MQPNRMDLFSGNPAETARRRFRRRLLRWYRRHRRGLPWRNTRDPYRIWISEIMLQQTRVAAVVGHYKEFLRRFPNLKSLAAARPSSVLAAWSGLGYYARARGLHAAAREVVRRRRGRFPRSREGLQELPGIGRYTAAAIASIAFGAREAVVDGNVARVLGRLSGAQASPRERWEQAESLLDPRHSGDFNQAMMELGATVCLPGVPRCHRCPVFSWCRTRGASPRQAAQSRSRKKQISFALAARKDAVLLTRRAPGTSLMPRMWELPQAPPGNGTSGRKRAVLFRLRHSITDTDYRVTVLRGATREGVAHGSWVRLSRLPRLPLTGLARKILRRSCLLG
jgi:A/G-specific adenine glycosylase